MFIPRVPFIAGIFALLLACAGSVPTPVADSEDNIDGFGLGDIINLLGLGLVTQINVFITLDSLVTNLVSVNFDVKNPLPFEITIDQVSSQGLVNSIVFAEFTQQFPGSSFIVPPLGSANSGTFGNVLLTQGALNSLSIIPLGVLDLAANVSLRVATIDGLLGLPIPLDGLKQQSVPTSYTLDIGDQ
ncbi:hypothetical protein K439DRAFT_1043754 [Ramaria rubella]|nr:hypothetical protein K439DRAFT_1043754 [Ramaria rubella]